MQGRREEQVFRNLILPATAALFCAPFPIAALWGSRSRVARARYAVRGKGYLLLGNITKELVSDAYLLSGSSVTWRKCFKQCLDLAGMHWRPDILVLQAGCQKIPVSSADPAYLGKFSWIRMDTLLRLVQDMALASIQAQQLGKASVASNIHVIWDLCGAVSAKPSWGQAQKCHVCLPKGQSHQYAIVDNCLFCLDLKLTLLILVLTQDSLFLAGTGKTFFQLWNFQFNTCSWPIFHVEFVLVFPQNQHFTSSELSTEEKTGFLTMNTALTTHQHYHESLQLRK